jgi:hypothetical protein
MISDAKGTKIEADPFQPYSIFYGNTHRSQYMNDTALGICSKRSRGCKFIIDDKIQILDFDLNYVMYNARIQDLPLLCDAKNIFFLLLISFLLRSIYTNNRY